MAGVVTASVGPQEVLLIGGRSGVGKTSVGYEVCELLRAAGVAHCLIEGDNLDAAYPKAPQDPHGTALTEANLAALWANYTAIGHRRLVYVNTVSVLQAPMVLRAMATGSGQGPGRAHGVLLTASDQTTRDRLGAREIGSALARHLQRSAAMAARLDAEAGEWVVRVPTDACTVAEVAATTIASCRWSPTR